MAEDRPSEIILIKYLEGELSPEERSSFEEHLKADEQLRQRLENLRISREAVPDYGHQNEIAKVDHSSEQSRSTPDMQEKTRVLSMGRVWGYSLGAACLLAVIIGIGIYLRTSLSPEKVYKEAYVQYALDRSRSQQQEHTPLENAYQNQNYPEVIRLSQQGNLSTKEGLLTGIAYLNQNHMDKAIPYFDQIRLDSAGAYREDGEFYLGLAYLKAKQYDKSLELFRKIQSEPNHLYHPLVSEKLIHDIEKLR